MSPSEYKNLIVNVYKLGRTSYSRAWDIQRALFKKLKNETLVEKSTSPQIHDPSDDTGNSLLIVEHDPVYTIGIRSKQYDERYVLRLRDRLAREKLHAEFVQTDRGGLITFHGPGQLVVYPILSLKDFSKTIRNKSIRQYVNLLEKTMIDSLDKVGIEGAQTVPEHPGVWLGNGERKIGFVGVACKRYVTMHGIAINCNCDLRWFDHIVSCGIEDKAITSIHHELSHHSGTSLRKNSHLSAQIEGLNRSHNFSSNPIEFSTDMTEKELTSDGISVSRLSESFCQSFSQRFECTLIDRVLHPSVICS